MQHIRDVWLEHVMRLVSKFRTSPLDAMLDANEKYNIEEQVAGQWAKQNPQLFAIVEIEAEKTNVIPKQSRLDI